MNFLERHPRPDNNIYLVCQPTLYGRGTIPLILRQNSTLNGKVRQLQVIFLFYLGGAEVEEVHSFSTSDSQRSRFIPLLPQLRLLRPPPFVLNVELYGPLFIYKF